MKLIQTNLGSFMYKKPFDSVKMVLKETVDHLVLISINVKMALILVANTKVVRIKSASIDVNANLVFKVKKLVVKTLANYYE